MAKNDHCEQVRKDWDKFWGLERDNNLSLAQTPSEKPTPFVVLRKIAGKLRSFKSHRLEDWIVIKEANPKNKKKVIEIGAGEGETLLKLAQKGANPYYFDISANALSIARSTFEKHGIKKNFILGSIFNLSFVDNSFDVVYNNGVLEHFTEELMVDGFKEMVRICKPGGLIIIIIPNALATLWQIAKRFKEKKGLWQLGYEKSPKSIKGLLKGIKQIQVIREYRIGGLVQLDALRCYFFFNKYLLWLYDYFSRLVNFILWPINLIPFKFGLLMVTVFKKN